MKTILEVIDLCKYYGEGESLVKAVDGVNLRIAQGEFVTIVGKSGSGKSTLLHLMGGLEIPTSGKVLIDGKNIASMNEERLACMRRRKIGFVFQSFNLIPSLSVWENIVLPIGLDGRKTDVDFVNDILETIGLSDKKDCMPNTLSGGQQQRTAIARAIASRPSVILADEPTGNLDTKTGDEVMALLKHSSAKYAQTLVVITHNEDIAQMAERTIILEDGRVVN